MESKEAKTKKQFMVATLFLLSFSLSASFSLTDSLSLAIAAPKQENPLVSRNVRVCRVLYK